MAIQRSLWGDEKKLPEVQVYVPSAAQKNAAASELNHKRLYEIEEMAETVYKFARTHRCYTVDNKGKKHYPSITEKFLNGMKILKKDWIELYVTLNNVENFHIFFNEMSKEEKELFQNVLCYHYVTENRAKEILGKKTIIKQVWHYWDEEYEPAGKLKQWYSVERAKSRDGRYGKGSFLELKEEMYPMFLPIVFDQMMDYPVHTELTDQEKKELKTYSGEQSIFVQLPILSSLYDSRQIEFGRNKVPSAAIKKAAKMLNAKEIFPNGDKDTALLAAYYIINSYSLYYSTHTRSKKTKLEPEQLLKEIFDSNSYDVENLIPILLPNITGFRKSLFEYGDGFFLMKDIENTLAKLHNKGWMEINYFGFQVRVYSEESEEHYMPFLIDNMNKVDLYNQFNNHSIFLDNIYYELSIPLIKSYLFMMAALGIVEIAYKDVTAEDKSAVSIFDGLKYVRLTNLGKYILLLTDKYERSKEEDITYFELDTESLIVKSLVDLNPYETILGSLAEHISKKMYKVTPESFLKDCDCKKDIENRISLFKDYICDKPSANWQAFFKQMLDRCNPMVKPKKQYKLLQLPAEDKELQRIVLSDPNIRKYIMKAEDYHILVEQDYYKKFCDTLKKYGYLL